MGVGGILLHDTVRVYKELSGVVGKHERNMLELCPKTVGKGQFPPL